MQDRLQEKHVLVVTSFFLSSCYKNQTNHHIPHYEQQHHNLRSNSVFTSNVCVK